MMAELNKETLKKGNSRKKRALPPELLGISKVDLDKFK
jgi:hypothetical protein